MTTHQERDRPQTYLSEHQRMTKMNLNHFISAMNFSYSESAPYDVFSADELGGGIGAFPMLWD
jgi:hypothetical protein